VSTCSWSYDHHRYRYLIANVYIDERLSNFFGKHFFTVIIFHLSAVASTIRRQLYSFPGPIHAYSARILHGSPLCGTISVA
jgi:hypothetical protein